MSSSSSSPNKAKHWKSPLHPILEKNCEESERQTETVESITSSFPLECDKQYDSKIHKKEASGDDYRQTVTVPYNGLYGFILGRQRHDKNESTTKNEEDNIMYYDDSIHYESRINKSDSQKQKLSTGTIKLDKLTKKLPIHCGCTFQATFEQGQRTLDSSDVTNEECEKRIIMLPFTSQVVDPLDCNVSNDDNLLTVLTNSKVARLLYIQKETKVSIEYRNICNNELCHHKWEWGLSLHQYRYNLQGTITTNRSSDNNNQKKSGDCIVKQETTQDSKRARLLMDQNVVNDDQMIVNFFPKEAKKKPLLCTTCYKKFPTTIAIYKHSIIAHIDTMAKIDSQELHKLIGPAILRKPLHAVFDDKYLVVVVKPQGLSVQGDKWTLAKSDLLMPFRLKKTDNIQDALSKPRSVHRLDSPTGGLLVVAKTHSSEVALKKCFAERSCSKRYRAIVFGRLEAKQVKVGDDGNEHHTGNTTKTASVPNQKLQMEYSLGTGIIDSPISGKESITHYSIICYTRCQHEKANGWITTVDLYPVTGRQHQLRRHCKLLGHPIWGDIRYGPYEKESGSNINIHKENREEEVACNPHSKLCLWALEIIFPHPVRNQDVHVKIEEPMWYDYLRRHEEKKWLANH